MSLDKIGKINDLLHCKSIQIYQCFTVIYINLLEQNCIFFRSYSTAIIFQGRSRCPMSHNYKYLRKSHFLIQILHQSDSLILSSGQFNILKLTLVFSISVLLLVFFFFADNGIIWWLFFCSSDAFFFNLVSLPFAIDGSS